VHTFDYTFRGANATGFRSRAGRSGGFPRRADESFGLLAGLDFTCGLRLAELLQQRAPASKFNLASVLQVHM